MSKKEIITILNKTDSVIRGIIEDLKEIHKYCDRWDYNIPQISWDKLKKYEDMLIVSTPKQRRESKT